MADKSPQQNAPKGMHDVKSLAALVGMSEADVRSLTKKGVLTAQDGLYDPARALVSITRHLVKTRDTAEAKARAAEAEAKLKERRLAAAVKSAPQPTEETAAFLGTNRKPLKRSRALGERICKRLEQGMSLRKACAGEIDNAAVLRWVRDSAEFAQQYARSREIGWLGKTDRMLELADEAHEAALDPDFGQQRIAACRFEVDTLKWMLAKMLPKIYGEKVGVQVLPGPGSITPTDAASGPALPNDEEERIIASIAERQARLMRMQVEEEAEDKGSE